MKRPWISADVAPLSAAVDTDRGRLGLARRLLEHVVGPAVCLLGLCACHFVVHEVHEPLGEQGDLSVTPSIRSETTGPEASGSGLHS